MAEAPARRQTRQRTAVAEALEAQGEFRSAQEIYDIVRQRGDSVGLTTVYRALQAMAEDGQVDVIVQPDRIIPSSSVSQPVDASPLASVSLCLKAYQTVIGNSARADWRARAKTERKPSSKNCRAPSLPSWR